MKIPVNTIQAVLEHYKRELSGIYSASELKNITAWIFEKQLKLSNVQAMSGLKERINESDLSKLEQMCIELKSYKPIQYVLGEAEFFRMKFRVNSSVLIPRPETEELVEKVIGDMKSTDANLKILDIGTGSACIPVALKKNIPALDVYALDISEQALDVARYNAEQNNADVYFFKTDILSEKAAEAILLESNGEKFDILISNPPYVLRSEQKTLQEQVKNFEPSLALFVEDDDPILFYRKIASLAPKILKKGGQIYFECHAAHALAVQKMLLSSSWEKVTIHADLSGSARFVAAYAMQ